ncbi:MAG: 4Fe-4S binding protein [Clostridiaceae bacterium]|nr:4Fe-4S binding protein [Clostridiaceae bacterium]
MKDKIIYFSGTGNTKLLAEKLGELLNVEAHSIEEKIDWMSYLTNSRRLIILYPVYFSVPPMILREFFDHYAVALENKEMICIVSQMCYSGDGARVVEDFLPSSAKLIDTHHINMPNNIPNIPFVPLATSGGIRRKVSRGLRKLTKIADGIKKENFKRRHTSKFSILLGQSQRNGGLKSEKSKKSSVRVNDDCISCGLCVRICPTNNFVMENKAVPLGECTLCLRCENKCPAKAITVIIDRPVKRVYPGPGQSVRR